MVPYVHCLARPIRLAAAADDDELLLALLALAQAVLPSGCVPCRTWAPSIADARALVSALLDVLPADVHAERCQLGHDAVCSAAAALDCIGRLLCASGASTPAWLALRAGALQRIAACAEAWPLGVLMHVPGDAMSCALASMAAIGAHTAVVHESVVRHACQQLVGEPVEDVTHALLRIADAQVPALLADQNGPSAAHAAHDGLLAVWDFFGVLCGVLTDVLGVSDPGSYPACCVAAHALRSWLQAGLLDSGAQRCGSMRGRLCLYCNVCGATV